MSAASSSTSSETGATTADSGRRAGGQRNTLRYLLLFVVPLIAILIALLFYIRGGRFVTTENAYVKAPIIAISADVEGRVLAVNVRNNQPVSAGDVLFKLDAQSSVLAVMEAEAEIELVRAEFEARRAAHQEAVLSVAEASDRVVYLRKEVGRRKNLQQQGLGGGQNYDDARFNLSAARQRVKVLQQRVQQSLAGFNGNPDMPVDEHPSYRRAVAQLKLAKSQLGKTTVLAPANGVVSNVELQAGEYVKSGQAVFSLIDSGGIWVEANLKETQLTHVKEGQSATLSVDAYPDIDWQATVSSIAPATGAQFTLLPPQNATGNWVKVVQRVPVNLQVQATDDAPALRAGMTVSVRIDTGHQRELPAILQGLLSGTGSEAHADDKKR